MRRLFKKALFLSIYNQSVMAKITFEVDLDLEKIQMDKIIDFLNNPPSLLQVLIPFFAKIWVNKPQEDVKDTPPNDGSLTVTEADWLHKKHDFYSIIDGEIHSIKKPFYVSDKTKERELILAIAKKGYLKVAGVPLKGQFNAIQLTEKGIVYLKSMYNETV
jgi:hypothetical protein